MKLGSPNKLEIKPNAGKTEFRWILTFPERHQPVEFETSGDGAMLILSALRAIQAQHGKPVLRVVSED